MSLNTIMKARQTLGALLGVMFGGRRDLYESFGYTRTVTYQQALAKYIRQGIASRVVNAPAMALWSRPPAILQDGNEVKIAQASNVNLWDAIMRADILAGIGEYSVLVIGFEGEDEDLTQPLNVKQGAELIYAQPYDFASCQIAKLNQDIRHPNYMKPELYRIKPENLSSTSMMQSITSFDVHYSRVIHFAENTLVNEIFGIPRLLKVWNDLEDLSKVSGGSSECFWLAGNRGLQIDVDKEMQLDTEDELALQEEVNQYVDGISRILKTRGVKINNLGSDIPDPKENFSMLISLISGTTGIPKRLLIGSEAGQLASDQDRINWAERIRERQILFGENIAMNQLIYRMKNAGVIAETAQITYNWPDPMLMTMKEYSEIFATLGRGFASIATGAKNMPEKTMEFYNKSVETSNIFF